MALSSVFTTGVISLVTVYAAGDKSLPGAWNVNDESDSYPIDTPGPKNDKIVAYAKESFLRMFLALAQKKLTVWK